MLMMARDRDYPGLRDSLKGKKVMVWTCNTCSRLCNGIGGTAAAERLAEALRKDGVEVTGVLYTSASCMEDKVRSKEDVRITEASDIILSVTCDVGSRCAGSVFGKPVLNPIVTFGPGYIREDGSLFVCTVKDGRETSSDVSEIASREGLVSEPFV